MGARIYLYQFACGVTKVPSSGCAFRTSCIPPAGPDEGSGTDPQAPSSVSLNGVAALRWRVRLPAQPTIKCPQHKVGDATGLADNHQSHLGQPLTATCGRDRTFGVCVVR